MAAGLPASLHRDGQPIRRLYPGWQAGTCHPAPGGMTVLILNSDQTGQEACWWLSGDGELLACHGFALPPQQREQAITAINPALHVLSTTLLSGEAPLPDAEELEQKEGLAQLRALPASARIQLLSLWFQTSQSRMSLTSPAALLATLRKMEAATSTTEGDEPEDALGNTPDDTRADTRDDEGADMPGREAVRPFSSALLGDLLGTRPAGSHTLARSPFTGRTLRAELTMPTEKGTAYRFSDDEGGTDSPSFYLFWPAQAGEAIPAGAGTPCLYYPGGKLLVGEGPFIPLLPVFLLSWFIDNPRCTEALKALEPFHLEDYGVGHASALWDNLTPPEQNSGNGQDEAGQMLSSFPFSSIFRDPSFGRRYHVPQAAMDAETDDIRPSRGHATPRQQDPSSS